MLASLTATLSLKDDAIAALKAEKIKREVDDVVEVALSEGKLLPAQEDWARKLGKENLASLKQYLAAAQPIAALTSTQTGGKAPEGNDSDALMEEQFAICRVMNITPEDSARTCKPPRRGNPCDYPGRIQDSPYSKKLGQIQLIRT